MGAGQRSHERLARRSLWVESIVKLALQSSAALHGACVAHAPQLNPPGRSPLIVLPDFPVQAELLNHAFDELSLVGGQTTQAAK